MSWHKIWLVLRREYVVNFRRPSFLFTAFGVPLISIGAMVLIFQFSMDRASNLDKFQRIAYLDRAGIVTAQADNPNNYQPFSDPALDAPAESATDEERAAHFDALESTAHRQLLDGDLDAYFVIADHYVLSGQINLYADRSVPYALLDNIESFLRGQIVAQAPTDLPVTLDRLNNPAVITIRDTTNDNELSQTALIGRFLLPFIFVFIYFMAASTTAQFLMSGVVDEKENRLMEILATSLRPIELLWGKVLGLGALSLTQVVLWTGAGLMIAVFNEDVKTFMSSTSFQAADLALVAMLFLINFLLFAAIMMSIGASVTAEAESRQIAGFITFITVLPLIVSVTFFNNPNGPLPVFFSLFPLTAAVALIMRIGLTAIPTWQMALSLTIQIVSAVVVIWLGARVFRLGMLMYGKPLTPRTLWQALREGRTTLTTAQPDYTEETATTPGKKRSLWR